MESFFTSISEALNPSTQFWTKFSGLNSSSQQEAKIHSGLLITSSKRGDLKEKFFILTQTRLSSIKSPDLLPKKFSVITWKKLELYYKLNTFQDPLEKLSQLEISSSNSKIFIFRLSRQEFYQDFYSTSKESFQEWVNFLSPRLILPSFNQDFSIVQEIGGGSHSTVYLAIHNYTGVKYAIKAINKEDFDQSSRTHDSLANEISIMRKLSHPLIVNLYFIYEDQTHIYFVLDYVPGGNLFQRIIQKGNFSEDSTCKIMKNLLQGLQYIHSLDLIYRDLKPQNILLDSETCDFTLKISNFSLVCETLDSQNHRCGSPGYVAPEILKKKPYTKKADIFSAGIIMFTLLSGRAPFAGKRPGEILLKNKECKIFFQDKYWKNVSKDGIDCLLKLIDADPEFRPYASEALEFVWFKMPLSKRVEQYFGSNSVEDSGISAELMRRMNRVRGKEGAMKMDEDSETVKGAKKVVNNPRNILGRLRVFDSSLG